MDQLKILMHNINNSYTQVSAKIPLAFVINVSCSSGAKRLVEKNNFRVVTTPQGSNKNAIVAILGNAKCNLFCFLPTFSPSGAKKELS